MFLRHGVVVSLLLPDGHGMDERADDVGAPVDPRVFVTL
ncbi:hypothetical protein STTU_5697 [Streptomyces sp. Tu6071]|nr:hypothetical protein STTU_5697 [Streptomyces sp. Tu6071]